MKMIKNKSTNEIKKYYVIQKKKETNKKTNTKQFKKNTIYWQRLVSRFVLNISFCQMILKDELIF